MLCVWIYGLPVEKGKGGWFSDLLEFEIGSGRVTFDRGNSKGIQEASPLDVVATSLSVSDIMIKIWSMKAKEAAAEKKKPKTSAAQIRVQKGKRPILSLTWH
jgi:hypothetical protein